MTRGRRTGPVPPADDAGCAARQPEPGIGCPLRPPPTHHVPVVAGKVAGKTVHTMAAIADLLTDDGFTVDDDGREARSAAVARWLDATAGEGGLVRQLANQYAEIGYFAVSALDAFGAAPRASARTGRDVHNDPPSAPLR